MLTPSVDHILEVMYEKSYDVVDALYYPNIIAVRKDKKISNKFDDTFMILRYETGYKPTAVYFDCTTDPGTYYMKNGLAKGTACQKPGHYPDCHALGLHKGYPALVQVGAITVYRDANKDDIIDYINEETGLFGINIHRANEKIRSKQVDKWSAGCTVLPDPDDFAFSLSMVHYYIEVTPQPCDKFNYTLLEAEDFR